MKKQYGEKLSAFPKRGSWKNTYPSNDIFKVLIIGSSQDYAISTAKWLAGNENQWRGVYKGSYLEKAIAFYFTWPNDVEDLHQNTIGIDILVLACENDNLFTDLKTEVANFSGVSVRILISDSKSGSSQAKQLDAEFLKRTDNNNEEIVAKIDAMDIKEYERLNTMFKSYDDNDSGTISIKEMPNIAKDLGIDQTTKTFKQSVLALDTNHDEELDLEEFLQWYKIGRTHSLAISKIYELNANIKKIVNSYLDFDALLKDMNNEAIANKLNTNNIKIFLESEKLQELVTRIHLKLTLGGPKRLEAAKNFLSKFTSIHSYTESSWINIAVFTKSLSITGQDLLEHMKRFQGKLLEWAEKNRLEGLPTFVNKFIEFRSYANETAANIYMKLKLDIEILMKSALEQILIIRDWLSDNKFSFDANMRIYSSACLGDLIKNKKTIADFLNEGEVEINGTLLKSRLRSLLSNLKPEYVSILGLFQLFFMSSNLNLKFKGPFDEFANEGSFKFFNHPLDFIEPFVEFIKSNFDPDVLKCFSRMEFTFNIFEMFTNLQVFSETLWS